MAKSGTEKEGGFTEAQLQELRVCFWTKRKINLNLIVHWKTFDNCSSLFLGNTRAEKEGKP
jgi:hypothetical protein